VANTTAILSILKTGRRTAARHSALLTFETDGNSGEEYLRFVPAFFAKDFTKELAVLHSKIALFRDDYLKYSKKPEPSRIHALIGSLQGIGATLFHKFSCNKIFDELFRQKHIVNLVIYTNDPSIPWQWTYDPECDQFACERFALGKLFMQDVNEDQLKGMQAFVDFRRDNEKDLSLRTFLKEKSALILVGDWRGDAENVLPRAGHEAARLLQTFRGKEFGSVKLVEGDDVQFLSDMRTMAHSIKIIHYAGHSSGKGLTPSPTTTVSAELIANSERRLTSCPVVFLNSCMSGNVEEVWQKSANLATAFLSLGACGCVVTSFPVTDPAAAEFSMDFYQQVLAEDNAATIGEAVRQIRIKQATDRELKNDLTRLFFDYYGDPRARLKASRLNRIRAGQTATYSNKKVYQELKNKLRD
jgi:CHAT domain